MKILFVILLLTITAPAQDKYRVPAKAFLLDKARAIEIYKGDVLQSGELAEFHEGDDTAGKVIVILPDQPDRKTLTNALVWALGIVPPPEVFTGCRQEHRGEECTSGNRKPVRF